MCSPSAPVQAISGFQATGLMVTRTIIGFPARGWSRRKSVYCGLQVIGDGETAPTSGTRATGDPKLASMAELTTGSAIPAWAFSEATGEAERTTTTAR